MKKWTFEYETDPDDIYFVDDDKIKELEKQEKIKDKKKENEKNARNKNLPIIAVKFGF
jgi:hypothetical protein